MSLEQDNLHRQKSSKQHLPRWKFYLFCLIPLLFLFVASEVTLRVIGFEYNPHDLHRSLFTANGVDSIQTNPAFPVTTSDEMVQFQSFPTTKSNTFRVAFIGGSSVWNLNRMTSLQVRLSDHLDRPVEFINMGVLGCGSNRCLWSAREAIELKADLILLYAGHNEFINLANPLTYEDAPTGLSWPGQNIRSFQLTIFLRDEFRKQSGATAKLFDRRLFTKQQKNQIYAQFKSNLQQIAQLDIPMIWATVASNLIKPLQNGAVSEHHSPFLKKRQIEKVKEQNNELIHLRNRGLQLFESGHHAEMKYYLREMLVTSPRPGRANRIINETIRSVASEYNIPLADVETRVEAVAPHGIPGDELFTDHCHLNKRGNEILLDTFAEVIIETLPKKQPEN